MTSVKLPVPPGREIISISLHYFINILSVTDTVISVTTREWGVQWLLQLNLDIVSDH